MTVLQLFLRTLLLAIPIFWGGINTSGWHWLTFVSACVVIGIVWDAVLELYVESEK